MNYLFFTSILYIIYTHKYYNSLDIHSYTNYNNFNAKNVYAKKLFSFDEHAKGLLMPNLR